MKVRRTLAAGLLTAALTFGGAQGQQIVHDPLNFAQLLLQLQQLKDSYTVLQNSYQQLVFTYDTLHHLNAQSLTTAANLLGNAQHLPGSAAAELPGLNYGSNLSGAGQQFYDQNHYYTPEGEDFNAKEMQRRAYATANLQGEAQTSVNAIEHRLAGLNELQASIPEQPDVTAVSAINARINSEQAFLANETNHLHNLQLLQQTQQQVDQQRAEQHGRQQIDEWNKTVAVQAWGN
jgi:hypothetical protein